MYGNRRCISCCTPNRYKLLASVRLRPGQFRCWNVTSGIAGCVGERGLMGTCSLSHSSCFLKLCLLLWGNLHLAAGLFKSAAILPHGGIALDPRHFDTDNSTAKQLAWQLHSGCKRAARHINALQPGLLMLTTPHGVADEQQYVFYQNPNAFGQADTDNCQCPTCCYHAAATLNTNHTRKLLDALKTEGFLVSGISAFGPPYGSSEPFPLRWGEVIPLSFLSSSLDETMRQFCIDNPSTPVCTAGDSISGTLHDVQQTTHVQHTISNTAADNKNGNKAADMHSQTYESAHLHADVMVLSMPSRRYTSAVDMIPELLSMGRAVHQYLDSIDESVVLVVSGDLAHTHASDGPYGFSEDAQKFDDAILQWARTRDRDLLISTASKYVTNALSCGFTGFVLLQGVLDAAMQAGKLISSDVHAVGHPSYYGMLAATFDFAPDDRSVAS